MIIYADTLAKSLSELSGVPRYVCRRMLMSLGDALAKELLRGNEVAIMKLGRFRLSPARMHKCNSMFSEDGTKLDRPRVKMTRSYRIVCFSTMQGFKRKINGG